MDFREIFDENCLAAREDRVGEGLGIGYMPVIAGKTQYETSVAAGLTKQIADELTAVGISFTRISSSRIA